MIQEANNTDTYKVEIFNINLLIILFLFRTAIPQFKYPFIILYFCFLGYFIIKYRNRILHQFIVFVRVYFIVLLLVFALLLSILLSNKLYLIVLKDFTNIIILLSLFFLLNQLTNNKKTLDFFTVNLIKLITFFAIIVSLFGIMNLFSARPGYELFTFNKIKSNLIGDVPYLDYNFALVPVFFGLASTLNYLTKAKSFAYKGLYSIVLVIFSINIFLAGSRRGILALSIIFIIVLFILIISLFFKGSSFKAVYINLLWFQVPIIVLTFLFYVFIFHTTAGFKISIFKFLNAKNIYLTTERVTWITNSYRLILNGSATFMDTYNIIWKTTFDPKDPDSGWGTRNHKTIYPLTGNNVEIVPFATKGYMLDNSCNSSTLNNNAYAYTLVGSDSVADGEIINASVYCYVSEDYNGTWARISTEGAAGYKSSNYELSDKGTWQKLSVTARCKAGVAVAYLYMSKYGDINFDNLKGNVIFAYPQFRKVEFDSKDPDTWGTREHRTIYPLSGKGVELVPSNAKGYLLDKTCDVSPWKNNAYAYTLIGSDSVASGEIVVASVYCYASTDFDGSWIRLSSEGSTYGITESYYDLKNKGSWQKLNLRSLCKEGNAPVYLYFSKYGVSDFTSLKGSVIFTYPQYKVIREDSTTSHCLPEIKDYIFEPLKYYHIGNVDGNFGKIFTPLSYFDLAKSFDLYLSSMPPLVFLNYLNFESNLVDPDPIRNFVKRLVSEDTTYYEYSANIEIDSISDNFLALRTVRWQFAWQIFNKEYSWSQKIFGGGFAYINWYGYTFSNDKTISDYPHNPFLSVLLYSGILGLILYLYLLYKVIAIYIRYIKKYYLLFIFFLITFFFSFFSGGSPFDPPIMGFFVMLPFLMDSILKSKESD